MRHRATSILASLLLAGASAGLVGCSSKDAAKWISDDAAVVRCTVAGSGYTLPDLAVELPAPATPTGLYARVLDPMALDDLGYTRDATVCASMIAPTDIELSETKAALAKLVELRGTINREARKLGKCGCEIARDIGKHDLIASCFDEPWEPNCQVKEFQRRDMAKLLEPLESAMAEAAIPRLHWRLAGPSDRPSRFLARSSELLPRHTGGSRVYQRGEPVPERLNHALISALLEEDGVMAVVRQDGGTALLVMRNLGGQLVLDHFAYPPVSSAMRPMLPAIDNAQIDRYRAQLAAPEQVRDLALDPKDGTLVELDHGALERVDQGLAEAGVLAGGYSIEREQRELPPILVDRVTFQVPFGEKGESARAVLRLSEEGRAWVAGLGEQLILDAFDSLEASEVAPELVPGGKNPGFVSRGEAPERVWFAGAHAFVEIARAIELASAGSMMGNGMQWTLQIPSGPLPGEFHHTPEELKRLRERLSKRPHELAVELRDDRTAIELTLRPK